LFLGVIVVCFYIIYRLVAKRQTILRQRLENETERRISELEGFAEGFAEGSEGFASTRNDGLPLNQYIIFSSLNSALSASFQIDLSFLVSVLKKGCRFLDFEIYSVDDVPIVGYSSSRSFTSIETSQKITFDDLCKSLANHAFIVSDPLFIHLRIKTTSVDILDLMAVNIKANFENQVFTTSIDPTKVTLSALKNKIIFIVDIAYFPNYKSSASFAAYVAIESGTPQLQSIQESLLLSQDTTYPLTLSKGQKLATTTKWMTVVPGFSPAQTGSNTTNFLILLKNYSVQIVPFKFYIKDDALRDYENFFIQHGDVGFVTLASAYGSI